MKLFKQVIVPDHHPFLNNKYTAWYYGIINNAKLRKITGYVEMHHIVPECLFELRRRKGPPGLLPGDSNLIDNFVHLTAREHIICHWLLVHMMASPWHLKLELALNRMSQQSFDRGITIPSIIYERMRKAAAVYATQSKWFTNGGSNTKSVECPPGYWPGRTLSEESIKQCKANGAKGAALSTRGPWYTDGLINIRSKNPPPGFCLGYTMTSAEQSKRRIGGYQAIKTRRQNKTDKLSEEAHEKIKLGRQGQIYWTDGTRNALSKVCPGEGWLPGFTKSEEYLKLKKNKKWWNNGVQNICAATCPDGYKPGRLKFKQKWWTNGLDNKMLQDCPSGYWQGRTLKPG